jgi:hypothetical protein
MKYGGRNFTQEEIDWMNALIQSNPDLSRRKYSARICEHLNWRRANGGLKDSMLRGLMLSMEKDGLIKLPFVAPLKFANKKKEHTQNTEPGLPIEGSIGNFQLEVEMVKGRLKRSLWKEYIDRYHYLGYRPLAGDQLRYFVKINGTIVSLLGFGAGAWKIAPREAHIGWNSSQKEQKLKFIVNNNRFLILQWHSIKNLASKILSTIARQLPSDWEKRYGYRPVLLETFVEKQRFTGACYKASNWIYIGDTKGRGRYDRYNKKELPIKGIWLYPLDKKYKEILSREVQA